MRQAAHRSMFALSGVWITLGVIADGFWPTVALFTVSGLSWSCAAVLENRP